MSGIRLLCCVFMLGLVFLGVGCSDGDKDASKNEPAPQSAKPEETVQAESTIDDPPAEQPQEVVAATPEPVVDPPVEEVVVPEPQPEPQPELSPEPEPAPQIPAEEQPQEVVPATPEPVSDPPVEEIAEEIAVPETLPAWTYIGATKCKMCHKVQYASWASSAHAEDTPPLDCEGCHGPGSAYKKKSVMEDPELARAAGLIMPEKAFCTDTCHQEDWQDDMLTRSHAHKGDAP